MVQNDNSSYPSLELQLQFFRRWWALLCICAIVGVSIGLGLSQIMTKQYTSTSSILFQADPLFEQLAGFTVSQAAPTQGQQDTNVELVRLGTTGQPALRTAQIVGGGLTASKVRNALSIAPDSDTNVVFVAATAGSGEQAATLANTYATQFVAQQQQAIHTSYETALLAVRAQYDSLSRPQQVSEQGLALQERAQAIGLLAKLQSDTVQLAQRASVPPAPSSPQTKLIAMLCGILVFTIGFVFALLRQRLDKRIADPKELEAIFERPVLATVPDDSEYACTRPLDVSAPTSEVFHLLRAHLRYFNVDRELRTVAIASAVTGEGKSTVSFQLAVAAARAGATVLLVEADLRRPVMAKRYSLRLEPGLSDILAGVTPSEHGIQTLPLSDRSMNDGTALSRMDVIVAGAITPPNPAELIESRAMEALLGNLRDRYDLVVIDTAPLMLVSDSIALLTKVDGVLLVSRMGVNRRDTAREIRDTLAGLRAPLLGVIANCVPTRPVARYRYGYGESSEAEGRRASRDRRDPGLASPEAGSRVFGPNA